MLFAHHLLNRSKTLMAAETTDKKEAQLRDQLALERTRLANERTLLAYIRTAIMLAATGATLISLYSDRTSLTASGASLISLGIAVGVIGASRYRKLARLLIIFD